MTTSVQLLSRIDMNMMSCELRQSNCEHFEWYTFSYGKEKSRIKQMMYLVSLMWLHYFHFMQHNSMPICMCNIFLVCFAERNLHLLLPTNKSNRILAPLLNANVDARELHYNMRPSDCREFGWPPKRDDRASSCSLPSFRVNILLAMRTVSRRWAITNTYQVLTLKWLSAWVGGPTVTASP